MREKLIFELSRKGRKGYSLSGNELPEQPLENIIPSKYLRTTPAELPEVAESEVVRHFVRLSNLNYHVDKNMYPLGSCTMKYNPKINDYTCDLPGFSALHPLQPGETTQGALQLMFELAEMLREIGVENFEALIADIPEEIRLKKALDLFPAMGEPEVKSLLEKMASGNAATCDHVSFLMSRLAQNGPSCLWSIRHTAPTLPQPLWPGTILSPSKAMPTDAPIWMTFEASLTVMWPH